MPRIPAPSWKHVERFFLATFVLVHAAALIKHWGEVTGYDAQSHLEMVRVYGWHNLLPELRGHFHAYHPPLGFWIAKAFAAAGLHAVHAIQLTSWLASLAGFLLLRGSLKRLEILRHPLGILLLYLCYSASVAIVLSRALSLDGIVWALASAALYCSVSLVLAKRRRGAWAAALACVLFAGLMTKFSGLLTLALPLLVIHALTPGDKRGWTLCLCSVGVALAAAFPYYYARYYTAEGTLLPSNETWELPERLEEARRERDRDRAEFFLEMLTFEHGRDLLTASGALQKAPSLYETWHQLWAADGVGMKPRRILLRYGLHLLALGCLAALFAAADVRKRWHRLGNIFLPFAAVQCAALIAYIYAYPASQYHPEKFAYVMPVLWALSYAYASLCAPAFWRGWRTAPPLLCVWLFMVVSHLLP